MAILDLQDVSYAPRGQMIIDHLNLTIDQGDFLTISGPSGGGKSTLLMLISTLLTPTSGLILFENQPQADEAVTKYRQEVSYCFQQPALFGRTVRDNVEFPFIIRHAEFDNELVSQYLRLVDLPEAYIDKNITELSGGEKQRVALIRNLLFLPKILLLDEVTVGLDQESKEIVEKLIDHVHEQGVTILMVTHDSDILRKASKIIWLKAGQLQDEAVIG